LSFNNSGLISPLLKALSHEGYETPTAVQQQCIPEILNGKDLLGCAQTGTGKTAAFALPILQLLSEPKNASPAGRRVPIKALILTPTRELAQQVGDSFKAYGRFLPLKHVVVFGGVPQGTQVKALQNGAEILVATPGRLLDLVKQRHIDLSQISCFVLDEADRMLDMGFINDVKKIIDRLPSIKQTLFFSATMPGPVKQLADSLLRNPVRIDVTPPASTVELIDQKLYFTERQNKRALLVHLLSEGTIETALVFTRTKHGADRLSRDLTRAGISSHAIHGGKTQQARQKALQQFKARQIRVLVATDIAARGIDIDELTHVINYELPEVPETYVHRIGRTGRAGALGTAISFCDYEEKLFLRDIQRTISKELDVVKGHAFDVPLMHARSIPVAQGPVNGRRPGGMNRKRVFVQRRFA
jgi:ATP-dependent RNA helicase RhlE